MTAIAIAAGRPCRGGFELPRPGATIRTEPTFRTTQVEESGLSTSRTPNGEWPSPPLAIRTFDGSLDPVIRQQLAGDHDGACRFAGLCPDGSGHRHWSRGAEAISDCGHRWPPERDTAYPSRSSSALCARCPILSSASRQAAAIASAKSSWRASAGRGSMTFVLIGSIFKSRHCWLAY